MRKVVHKFQLSFDPTTYVAVRVPIGSRPIHVNAQRGKLYIWFERPADVPCRTLWHCRARFTGQEFVFDENYEQYVGTAQLDGYVYHVYAEQL